MTELIITVSGLRGIIGQNLTPQIAASYGAAFGTFLKTYKPGKITGGAMSVCIGRDSRPSGQMLFSAVASGLCAAGVDVIDLGIVPTPSVGVMVRHLGCAGGVVITASHNPIEYNGIKLLLDDGIAPSVQLVARIRQIYFDSKPDYLGSVGCGRVSFDGSTDAVHIDKVLRIVDVAAIAARSYRVAVDSVNGAGGPIAGKLLSRLGCDVVAVNYEPTGLFAHTPEPTAENLAGFCQQVRQAGVDIGFALDPDADRLAIIDQTGRYIGEEYTLALVARYIFSRQKGLAAANLSTSRMIDDIAAAAGGGVIRTAVGEANVAEAMVKNNCIIGGEGNGGVIDLRVGPVRDSLVAMALVLGLMTQTGQSVGALADGTGSYCMVKLKFPADSGMAGRIIEKARSVFTDAQVNTTDGCRFDFPDGWVHIRASNTEPIVRIIIEAKDRQHAQKYIGKVDSIRKELA